MKKSYIVLIVAILLTTPLVAQIIYQGQVWQDRTKGTLFEPVAYVSNKTAVVGTVLMPDTNDNRICVIPLTQLEHNWQIVTNGTDKELPVR